MMSESKTFCFINIMCTLELLTNKELPAHILFECSEVQANFRKPLQENNIMLHNGIQWFPILTSKQMQLGTIMVTWPTSLEYYCLSQHPILLFMPFLSYNLWYNIYWVGKIKMQLIIAPRLKKGVKALPVC